MKEKIAISMSKSFLKKTSPLITAPARGALKMAAIPAPSPPARKSLFSFSESLKYLAKFEPTPAPIKAIGPSLPETPPVPIIIAEVSSLTKESFKDNGFC